MNPTTPTPSNGHGQKTPQVPSDKAPAKDVAAGPQTPAPTPQAPDDPEYDLGDGRKIKRSALNSELGRARNAAKMLTEASRRSKEAAELKAQLDARLERIKGGDENALEELLADMPQEKRREYLSRFVYSRFVEPEQLTDEQRRIRELEAKLTATEQKERSEADARKSEAAARAREEAKVSVERELIEMASAGKVRGFDPENPSAPRSALALRRFAEQLLMFEEAGLSPTPELLSARTDESILEDIDGWMDGTPLAERKELLGPDKFKAEEARWREWFLAKLKAKPAPESSRPQSPKSQPRKKMTPQEWLSSRGG